MLAGTFTTPDDAMTWLEGQLAATPPMTTALSISVVCSYARQRLTEHPGDQVTRYYTTSAYVCRDLVRCPNDAGPCPQRP
jgi:hypothetical protein